MPDAIFKNVKLSGDRVFWGACAPASSILTVHVDESARVYRVLIALRLESKKTADATAWGGYAIMDDAGGSTFSYRLTARSFSHYTNYMNAWGQFQLIALDRSLRVIGRSAQYLRAITVAPCS